ncbi:hypothetical protein PflCFBP13510_26835 [Pseudomonas fluorescens]|nr:hypothetical protein PflCFBP13510_26835 [Pseudomonas fluorescens]
MNPGHQINVGASLLAKNVNGNACFLNNRGACEFFASKLAPTVLISAELEEGALGVSLPWIQTR